MRTILHSLIIKSKPETVFLALTTADGLSNWWSNKVTYDGREKSVIHFRFLEGFNPEMLVEKMDRNESVKWKCVGGHDNWQDNTFTFDLSETDEGMKVRFTQHYAKELDDDVYGTYNFNWGYYLNSLKQFCETGEGAPYDAG